VKQDRAPAASAPAPIDQLLGASADFGGAVAAAGAAAGVGATAGAAGVGVVFGASAILGILVVVAGYTADLRWSLIPKRSRKLAIMIKKKKI